MARKFKTSNVQKDARNQTSVRPSEISIANKRGSSYLNEKGIQMMFVSNSNKAKNKWTQLKEMSVRAVCNPSVLKQSPEGGKERESSPLHVNNKQQNERNGGNLWRRPTLIFRYAFLVWISAAPIRVVKRFIEIIDVWSKHYEIKWIKHVLSIKTHSFYKTSELKEFLSINLVGYRGKGLTDWLTTKKSFPIK